MVWKRKTQNVLKFLLIFYTIIYTNAFSFRNVVKPKQAMMYLENSIYSSQLWNTKNSQTGKKSNHINSKSRLYGIDEWRDTIFDIPDFNGACEDGIPREVTVLPFPYQDVLLQGETKQLRLYEDRYVSRILLSP